MTVRPSDDFSSPSAISRLGPATSLAAGMSRKSKLLLGAASLAVAVHLPAAAEAEWKWQPWIAPGGMLGSEQQGELDIFVPMLQDPNAIVFLNARGIANSEDEQQGSLGFGYRAMVNSDWIVGLNGFLDVLSSRNDNTFYQGGVGVEALTEDIDLRINGHFPDGGPALLPGGEVFVDGTDFGITTFEERALAGFDGEVGYKLPLFEDHPFVEVRAFAGGFYYWADNVDDIVGPKGRVEARLYDIEFLAAGSRVEFGAEVRYDDVRGTEGFGSAYIRIPLTRLTGNGDRLTGLNRRMVDRIVRDKVITEVGYNTEAVFVENGEAPVDTIIFTESGTYGGGGGSGAEGDPADLKPGIETGAMNSLVVLDGGEGAYVDDGSGLFLHDDQSLIGGGKTVKLTGVDSGNMTYFTAPGSRPTITGTDGGTSLIRFGDNATVGGLDLDGTGDAAILGADYRGINNFTLMDNTVAGAFADDMRVYLVNPGSSGVIMGNSLGGASDDGISVSVIADDGGASTFDLTVDGNTVVGADGYGITVNNIVENGSELTASMHIGGNYVRDIGDGGFESGILVYGNVSNSYSLLVQDIDIENNSVQDVFRSGIVVWSRAVDNGTIDQENTINIDNNVVEGAGRNGVYLYSFIDSGGVVNQTANVAGNTVTYSGFGIVGFSNVDGSGSNMTQTLSIYANDIAHMTYNGVYIQNVANNGAVIDQNVTIGSNRTEDTYAEGIRVASTIDGAGTTLIQTAVIENNDVSHVTGLGNDGIRINTTASNGAFVDQESTIEILGNTIRYTYRDGIRVDNTANSASQLLQTILIDDNLVDGGNTNAYIGRHGINVVNTADGVDTLLRQSITIGAYTEAGDGGNIVQFTDNHGIRIRTDASNGAVVDQGSTIDIGYNTVFYAGIGAGSNGIIVTNLALYDGVTITQTTNITGNDVTYSGADGIRFSNDINSTDAMSRIDQTIGVAYNEINYNIGYGVFLSNIVSYDGNIANSEGTIDQSGDIIDNTFVGNGAADVGTFYDVDGNGVLNQNVNF